MKILYLLPLFLIIVVPECLSQVKPDTIYKLDRSKLAAIIDEVSEQEVFYFVPGPTTGQNRISILRAKVWKVVYSNGETEIFNALPQGENPAVEKSVTKEDAIVQAPPAQEAAQAKPQEVIIKIQHEPAVDPAADKDRDRGKKYKNYVGSRFGGTINSFYKDKIEFPAKPFYNWEVALGISLASYKHYNARLELMYANKGSRDTFTDQFTEITSRNKITYAQANLLPVIIKSGARKLNPAIGFGGYYAYRIKHVSEFKEFNDDYQPDELTQELIDHRFDYGACVMLALYNGHKPLREFCYEYGLAEVISGSKIRNNGLSASLFLSF